MHQVFFFCCRTTFTSYMMLILIECLHDVSVGHWDTKMSVVIKMKEKTFNS